MAELDQIEKAALHYYVETGTKDKALIFQLAQGKDRYNKLTDKSKNVTVYKWFNRPEVKEFIKVEIYHQETQKRAEEERIRKESQDPRDEDRPISRKSEDTNFLNLDEFLKYANNQANNIQDEKEKRAWVEMIGKYMNFKESDEQEQQIKAYLPVVCSDCDIYKRCSGCSGCYKLEQM